MELYQTLFMTIVIRAKFKKICGGRTVRGHFMENSFLMGILIRKPDAIRDMHLSDLDSDLALKPLRDSRKDPASLVEFLNEWSFITRDDYVRIEWARKRVEASGLASMMMETCTTINRIVGENIVDMHSFLSPEPVLCCFIYVEGGTEYFMRLELQGAVLTLSFAERKSRDTVSIDFLQWVHRLDDIETVGITVRLVHEFQEIRISVEQVRECFKYLISRLDRSYMPSFSYSVS
jgi:hypothetical protein